SASLLTHFQFQALTVSQSSSYLSLFPTLESSSTFFRIFFVSTSQLFCNRDMDHHFTHEDIPMCVLIGHNGAGKKTLLSSITSESDIPPQVKNGLGYIPFEVINTYPEGEIDERKTICNMMVVPCHMMYVPQMSTRLSKAQLAIMVS
ncbi:hypothetical protein Leryth_026309, partial [Lithospermum erythrorhizon]